MKEASALKDQNRFAYEAKYLNKSYRVVGRIYSVKGSDPGRFVMGFEVFLEPWEELGMLHPILEMPMVELLDLPEQVQLSMRPGQEIDATCVLKEWMEFRSCHLNKPVGSADASRPR